MSSGAANAPSAQSSTPQQQPTPPTSGTATPQPAPAAAAAGRSYASAANRKSFGASVHSKSESLSASASASASASNSRSPISPAVPSLGGPTIINGNAGVSQASSAHEHSRKPSVTISAAGSSGQMPNGGPVAGQAPSGGQIQFGSINNGSQSYGQNAMVQQDPNTLAVNAPNNPRITSPANSPSPIPQPAVPSGGKPPSSLHAQSQSLSFGAFPTEDPQRRSSVPGQGTPNMQNAHLRRDSSSHNQDMNMGPGAGRGGNFPGRGRGGFNPGYNGQMPHSPSTRYSNIPPAGPRGPGGPNMGPQYNNSRAPYGQGFPSPHQAARSPSMAHAQPVPHQGHMPMASPGMPNAGYPYPPGGAPNIQQMQGGYYDPNQGYYNQQGYMQQAMYMPPQNGYNMQQGPNSPRPHYQTPGMYMNTSYPQPPTMSRQGSTVSTERPASTLGQPPQAPMTPGPSHQHTVSRGASSPGPKSQYQIPAKKASSAIKITNPNTGEAVNFDKPPASPAPSNNSKAAESAPTPPRTPSQQHQRSDSKTHKGPDEVRNNLREQVQAKIKADQEAAQKAKEEEEEKRRKEQEEIERAAREKAEAEEAARKAEEEKKEQEEAERAAKEAEAARQAAREAEEARLAQERAIEAEKAKAEQEAAAKKKIEEEKARAAEKAAAEKAAAEKAADEKAAAEKAAKEQAAATTKPKAADDLQPPEMPDVDASDEVWEQYDKDVAAYEDAKEAAYKKKKSEKKAEEERNATEKNSKLDEELKKQEAEAERLEAEKEKKREIGATEDKDAFAQLKKSSNAFRATETATESLPDHGSRADTPTSGTATPKSDAASMPPPSRLTKAKPAALKLETQKQVEAAQPSAALQSLRSARRLAHFNPELYPQGIQSPNPALNTNAKGSFRYDKDFLLQFQKVFTEKPSETWSEKLKETVGDPSETPGSARGTRSLGGGGRSGSRVSSTPVPPFNNMGQFGTTRTLPLGTTSADRFSASSSGRGAPNVIRYDGSKPGGFPGGFPVPRQGSNPPLISPRPSAGGRGSHRGASKAGGKNEAKDAAKMPLTAGQDIKALEVSTSGWKPMSIGRQSSVGPPPGGENGYLAPDVVQRKVKSSLNKMTPTTFEKISGQILDIVMQSKQESDGRTLRQVIQLTFEKATDEAHWAEMYAQFCGKMLGAMTAEIRDESSKDKHGNVVSGSTLFRKYLLNRCQQDFEQGWKSKLPEAPTDKAGGEAAMLSDEYYIAAAAKRRGLGLVRFIGELYKLGMLTARIMHMCVQRLVDFEGVPDEAEVESLTSLLRTIGAPLDADEKSRGAMNIYFGKIDEMMKTDGIPSRLQFMLMDIVDLRKHNWQGKGAQNKAPQTIDQVRAEVAAQQREQEARAAAEQQRSRGPGGGRPAMGRGDARNFSGPPPTDFASNRVGMDDLRRLGKSVSTRSNNQGPMGPTSMFNTRGSNKRATMAPGGIFAKGATDESAASSRTATPPIRSDKERREDAEKAAAGANTFSALAALESTELNDANSTPAASPPTAKRPLPSRTRSKSPEKSGGPSTGA